ncbi:phage antirepressor KilAC domain-containing protein, partial [Bifidobacterium crudilactis]|uniref:phage antirepressor KilAC domain-containing protein n=2 Tax=Bifidobacterium crudilactis TaxID=327277 RepID=UPI0026489222
LAMSNIQPFDFEGTPVRTITYETGVTWWVLKDVCDALALSNPTMIAGRLEEDERAKSDLGRQGEAWIINESGLYNVILRSDKPEARRFRKWVTHTVLPQIRRTGGYIPMTEADDEKTILAKAMIISQRTMEMQKLTIQQQKTRLDVVEPKAQALDDLTSTEHLYTLTEAAQLLNNGGDGFGLKRLTNWLRTNKWIRRENKGNAPYQDKIDSGLLTTKAYKARFNPENGDYQTFTPKILVTAKGVARLYKQIYGISRASIEKAA